LFLSECGGKAVQALFCPQRGIVKSGARWWRTLKLDPAVLRIRRLLDGDHLALHLRKLGRRPLVTADEERCRPEYDDRRGRRPAVFGALAVL
jgi:hypothetical protein